MRRQCKLLFLQTTGQTDHLSLLARNLGREHTDFTLAEILLLTIYFHGDATSLQQHFREGRWASSILLCLSKECHVMRPSGRWEKISLFHFQAISQYKWCHLTNKRHHWWLRLEKQDYKFKMYYVVEGGKKWLHHSGSQGTSVLDCISFVMTASQWELNLAALLWELISCKLRMT